MSRRASTWALDFAPVDDPTSVLILMALADNAHEDGTHAFISVGRMAYRARCSDRTVQRKLRELEESGVIRRGDQDLAKAYPADRRPVVWELNISAVRGDSLSPHGVTDSTPRGDKTGGGGVTLLSPKTNTNQELNQGRPAGISAGIPPSLTSLRSAPLCRHEAIAGQCALCRTTRTIDRSQPRSAPRCQHGEPIHRHPDCNPTGL